jgi:hypothetical protein
VENKISVNAVAERTERAAYQQTFISFNLSVSTRFVESGEDFEHHQTGSPFPASPRAANQQAECVRVRWCKRRVRKIAYIFTTLALVLRPTLFFSCRLSQLWISPAHNYKPSYCDSLLALTCTDLRNSRLSLIANLLCTSRIQYVRAFFSFRF